MEEFKQQAKSKSGKSSAFSTMKNGKKRKHSSPSISEILKRFNPWNKAVKHNDYVNFKPDEYEAQALRDSDLKQPCLTSFEMEEKKDNLCTENEGIQFDDGSREEFPRCDDSEDESKLLENIQILATELDHKLKLLVNKNCDTEIDQDGKYANDLSVPSINKSDKNIDLDCSKHPPLPPRERINISKYENLPVVADEINLPESVSDSNNRLLELPEKPNCNNKPPMPKRLPKGRVVFSYQAIKTGDIDISIDDEITILSEGK